MTKKTITCIGTSLLIFLAILYFLKPTNKNPQINSQNTVIEVLPPQSSTNANEVFPFDKLDYVSCVDYKRVVNKAKGQWKQNKKFNWISYLEQGYTLDQVTTAADHFVGFNWASQWRREQLTINSSYQKNKTKLRQEISNRLGREIPQHMNIEPKYPSPEIIKYIKTDDTGAPPSSIQPTIDDLAALVADKNINEDVILNLISSNNLTSYVGYQERQPLSLAGYAALHSRKKVVEHLIERDAIKGDSYLGNPLEWALKALSKSKDNTDEAVEIIKLLHAQGLTIRKNSFIPGFNGLRGRIMFGQSYEISEEKLRHIKEKYNLDLTQLTVRENINSTDQNETLKQALISDRNDYTAQQLGDIYNPIKLKTCHTKVDNIAEQVKMRPSYELISSVSNEQDFQGTLEELALIDPSLASCYFAISKSIPYDNFYNQEIAQLITDKKYSEAITQLESFSLNTSKKATFFWENSRNDEFIPYMIKAGIMAEGFNFKRYLEYNRNFNEAKLEVLVASGIDTFNLDSNKHSLLYYMVAHANLKMVDHLVKNGYDFANQPYDDPLHAILSGAQPNIATEQIIDLIMPLVTTIDSYHLSRMKIISIKFPKLYEKLIAKYPSLKITEKTTIPISICQTNNQLIKNKY